ncbi:MULTISPECIES: undecaprenyldiphospho-muramoylpentapeptide beta-N-acetylglucosaminyltransferase [Bacillaceae]|uniref:undecaprenyldiphospho-muramoylpentapeptide beta-N-acetylglucosaminyltransferase n=1 Tax=Bacillaceae TaxID=186817 RepID=UPI001C573AAE|nr:undecaprenyldiphospho-muramoylpentapeptide beta-N-acetylglucosaminyltransferase [Rossellomorea sp. YZS02]MBW3113172.1 undecaprenyldiphospho-muramoylpentapeptide beta-N-acetylglucosaminyltransferase [Bacillus sp. MCCB 382]MDX8343772.1 undecaprenyldiphospho-muramoylpentapeptide beta-N-acetylglucosaminyltransferase [Rossellomorea sp. YZS02]
MTKRILFTGGGSAGHVTVNTALIPYFESEGWDITYIGSEDGIEKEIITEQFPHIPYKSISSGKLRRYFSWKNFSDPFRVMKGVFDALSIIRKVKPDIIFSKGGFVSVPVVMAAKIAKIPVAIHESDVTPGLANKLAVPFATKIFTTFPETVQSLPSEKSLCAGAIIREELFTGDASEGKRLTGYYDELPILMIMGGSLGARKINEAVRGNLQELLSQFQIIHICGKGNVDDSLTQKGYRQYEFIKGELPHYLAMTDFVISRAGSNSIFEFLALKKPMLLIPLSREASRGDQILNANSFVKHGYAMKLEEEELNEESFLSSVNALKANRESMIHHMDKGEKAFTIQDMYNELSTMSR